MPVAAELSHRIIVSDGEVKKTSPLLERLRSKNAAFAIPVTEQRQEKIADVSVKYKLQLLKTAINNGVDFNDAEDTVQDCVVKALTKSDSYDPAKGTLSTWMQRITKNTAIDVSRTNARRKKSNASSSENGNLYSIEHESIESVIDPSDDLIPHNAAVIHETRDVVANTLNELPPAQRVVLHKLYIEGKTQRQVAGELGIPLGTLKTRTSLGKEKMRMKAAIIDLYVKE